MNFKMDLHRQVKKPQISSDLLSKIEYIVTIGNMMIIPKLTVVEHINYLVGYFLSLVLCLLHGN